VRGFLVFAYLFFIGSVMGWILELLYRNLKAKNKKWINPGFCTGPYLPIYGFGLCVIFSIALLEKYEFIAHPIWNKLFLFAVMAVLMTVVEYVAGLFCLKVLNVRLWDYSDRKFNVQGIICPTFTFYWMIIGAIYYFFIHPHIIDGLLWLADNLAFSFFIGIFFGVFIVDVFNSSNMIVKLRRFAKEMSKVLDYENIKNHVLNDTQKRNERYRFFSPFRTGKTIGEVLKDMAEREDESISQKDKEE